MATSTETRRIQIIADGSSVNASMQQMTNAARLLQNELKKLPANSQEFADKTKQFQEVNGRLTAVRNEVRGTEQALGGATKASGLLKAGMDMAVKAFLPLFAFSEITKLIKGLFELEGQWSKLRGEIQQTSDLQGESLDQAAIRAEAIANTFGQTNTEVFANAKTLVKNFGVSYEEAFDIVEKGLLVAGKNGGEFLEQIKEYSVQFADAGASAEDFAVQTVAALNDGIYSDKGADAIKEFGLRVREQTNASKIAMESAFGEAFTKEIFDGINNGSLTTVDALKRISKEMGNTNIPANKLQTVIADMFGGAGEDAGIEYLLSLQNIGGTMDDLIDTESAYVKQQQTRLELEEELARAQEAFTEQMEGSNSVMGNLMIQAKILFFDTLGRGLVWTRDKMIEVINYFIELYNNSIVVRTLVVNMVTTFKNVFDLLSFSLSTLWNNIKIAGSLIKAVLTGDFMAIPGIIKDAFKTTVDNAKTLGQDISDNVQSGMSELMSGEKIELIKIDPVKVKEDVDQVIEVVDDGNDRLDENQDQSNNKQIEKEKAHQENLKKLREDYEKAKLEAQKNAEDLAVQLIEDAGARKQAKADLDFQREMAQLATKRQAVLDNEALTEEERNALLALYEEERAMKEQIKYEEDKELRHETMLADLEEDNAIETEKLAQLFEAGLISEAEMEQRRLELQKEFLRRKLEILELAGEGETAQAQKLKTGILAIEKDLADGKISEAQRAEAYKKEIQQIGLENARGFMQLGLDLLNKDGKARKSFALAAKALDIGMIVSSGVKEIAGYWEKTGAGIPIVGPPMATALSIAAGIRTLGAVNRIRTAKYATGGVTGGGSMMDMSMDASGTWRMPDGVGTRNVGSFASGGHVGSASFGVIGERGAEWVGPNWMMRSPKYANIFGYLEAERRKATPFAVGGSTAPTPTIPSSGGTGADVQNLMAMMEQFGDLSMKLDQMVMAIQEWPTRLRVVNDPRDILDGVRVLNEIEADSRINR